MKNAAHHGKLLNIRQNSFWFILICREVQEWKTIKKFGRIAGFLFLSNTLITIISSIYSNIRIGASVLRISFAISSVPWAVAILFTIGLIKNSIKMARVSRIIGFVFSVISLIAIFIMVFYYSDFYSGTAAAMVISDAVVSLSASLLILLGLFTCGKKARLFCLVAFVFEIIRLLAPVLYNPVQADGFSTIVATLAGSSSVFQQIVYLIQRFAYFSAIWFLGLYLQNRPSPGSHSHDDASAAETQG